MKVKVGTLPCTPPEPTLAQFGKLDRLASAPLQLYALWMLEENEVSQFAQLWRDEFNEELSPEEARRVATLLLKLYAQIYGPAGSIPSDKLP